MLSELHNNLTAQKCIIYFVVYLYSYIAPLAVHTKQRRFHLHAVVLQSNYYVRSTCSRSLHGHCLRRGSNTVLLTVKSERSNRYATVPFKLALLKYVKRLDGACNTSVW